MSTVSPVALATGSAVCSARRCGLLISRDAQGLVQGYWMAAAVGILASLLSMAVVGRLIWALLVWTSHITC